MSSTLMLCGQALVLEERVPAIERLLNQFTFQYTIQQIIIYGADMPLPCANRFASWAQHRGVIVQQLPRTEQPHAMFRKFRPDLAVGLALSRDDEIKQDMPMLKAASQMDVRTMVVIC